MYLHRNKSAIKNDPKSAQKIQGVSGQKSAESSRGVASLEERVGRERFIQLAPLFCFPSPFPPSADGQKENGEKAHIWLRGREGA